VVLRAWVLMLLLCNSDSVVFFNRWPVHLPPTIRLFVKERAPHITDISSCVAAAAFAPYHEGFHFFVHFYVQPVAFYSEPLSKHSKAL